MEKDLNDFPERINRKEETAWKELYRYYYASLCSYAVKIIGNRNAAEDITQNCFIRLWDSSCHFPDTKSITGYMYRVVYHAALNYLRQEKNAEHIYSEWSRHLQEQEHEAKFRAMEEEIITRFYTVIYQLPFQQREIIIGSLKGEKVQEIAQRLGISENTVKTQKRRAYQYLRKNLQDGFSMVMILLFS